MDDHQNETDIPGHPLLWRCPARKDRAVCLRGTLTPVADVAADATANPSNGAFIARVIYGLTENQVAAAVAYVEANDFLDDFIAESEAKAPGFAAKVDHAYARRATGISHEPDEDTQ